MPGSQSELERRLWDAADELRANSRLRAAEYAAPVLGLIFLRCAELRDAQAPGGTLRLPEQARFTRLLQLAPAGALGPAVDAAMRAVERANPALAGALPGGYGRLDDATLAALLRGFAAISPALDGDALGRIYEYFLARFALSEGQKGGEFFTPAALVQLLVEVLAPYRGRIYDPACGSGGMFVQSARFVASHRRAPGAAIQIYGQEKHAETVALCRMNLAVHGLAGDIRQGNVYYEDLHDGAGSFDFVLANPPFNVGRVDKARLAGDRRYALGLPRADNANYLWVQIIHSALSAAGRAGFVMANSACDTRGSELTIRRRLIETGAVDALIAVGQNFFYTVTLPCTLWFLDRGKAATPRRDQVLFVDARPFFRQVDRVRRDFSPAQIGFLADIVRLYRGEAPARAAAPPDEALPDWERCFPTGVYRDVPGLCRAATLEEIAAQDWSLSPSRFVGAAERHDEGRDFAARLAELRGELAALSAEARALEAQIDSHLARLLAPGATDPPGINHGAHGDNGKSEE